MPIKWFLLILFSFSALINYGQAPQTFTFSTSGSSNWTCPAGVTSITVECWGGGGAGGGSVTVFASNAGTGGGGGGYTKATSVSVTPSTSYPVTVGQGGVGNVAFTVNGNNGGNSYFSTNTALAYGGNGGGGNGGTAGNGGSGTFSGGNGAAASGSNKNSGGGGGGAGSASNGGNASQITPGPGGTGNSTGNGGAGIFTPANGNPGNSIGGGGSGAGQSSGLQSWTGGSGANGQVIITNTTPPTITALSSNICAGGSITITGTNFVGVTTANVTIGGVAVSSITSASNTQIVAVVNTACSGTVKVTTTYGTATSTGTFISNAIPTVSATTTYTCVGGSSGTITATGIGGSTPYTYSLNGGTYQAGNLFSGLAAGTYTLSVKSNTGCISATPPSVIVSPYPNSTDDQTLAGSNTWIGHMYNGMNFQNYIGHFTEAETFDEGFGGDYNCFTVSSGATYPSIYTEQFSVKFRMNSTRKGLYAVDLGSDDGSRLYIDGNLIYDNWVDQSFTTRSSVLMNLTGSNSLVYEYYENLINNRVIFNNLQLILANNLSTNATQSICIGSAGSTISGDSYGTLPSGISLSGTGYQWTYSTTPTGPRTNISGAISATFTPNTSTAPFNIVGTGTYYIYRDAIVNSTNNIGESPYVATNESNVATIIVNPLSVGGTVGNDSTVCSGANTGTVHLTGQTGDVVKWQYSSDGGTSWTDIANITNSQTYNNLAQTTLGRAVVQSGACPSVNSSPVTITVNAPGSWSGSVSTDWNDTRNWLCGAIPTSALDVTISSGASFYPVISGVAAANNITIQSGGKLTVGSGTLQIFGSVTNSGTLDATAGTIEMKGASAQTLDGSMFSQRTINNLIVSNTGTGLSVASTANDTLKITGALTFGNSTTTLNTNGNITLVSNAAGTASVGILNAGNTINGKVTVERYVNTGTASGQHAKSWEFLATPTVGQTVKESWMEGGTTPVPVGYGTQITGAGGTAAGFDDYTASPSLKYYNPASDAWIGITNTNNSIYNQSGYMVFVRGDRSVTYPNPANNTTLRTKGTLFTGTLSPISVTPDKYASVGNPYASPVDFTLIAKGAGIDDQFYVWDPYLYGSYGVGGYQTLSSANEFKPIPGGTLAYPSGTPYYILQSGQAFFVHATSSGSYSGSDYQLTFSENSKSNSPSTNVARMNGLAPGTGRSFLGVSLYTGNTIADGNTVAFDRNYSDNVDGNDAMKLTNGGENFGLKRNGKLLAIEARSPAVASDTLYYYMTNLQQKTYQLRFAPVNMGSAGLQAYLVDNFLNTSTPLSLTDSSFINITITSNPASSASGRFEVIFRTLSVTPVTFTSITAVQKNADIEVDWKVENESGIQQYEVEESEDGNQFTQITTVAPQNNGGNYNWLDVNATPGYHYYRVRSIEKDGQVQYTQIVKVLIGKTDASFSVYPNPIMNGNIHLEFNNQPAGVYGVRLMNSLGQIIVQKVINHGGGNSMEEITPRQNLAKGIYQLEVTKPGGNVEVVKVLN